MTETPTIKWDGNLGEKYTYFIYPLHTSFKEEPGNYIFAQETKPSFYKPLYIGQTSNLNHRLENHEKEDCAIRNGATHIHAHINNNGEETRKSEEKDLIMRWSPICNDQFTK